MAEMRKLTEPATGFVRVLGKLALVSASLAIAGFVVIFWVGLQPETVDKGIAVLIARTATVYLGIGVISMLASPVNVWGAVSDILLSLAVWLVLFVTFCVRSDWVGFIGISPFSWWETNATPFEMEIFVSWGVATGLELVITILGHAVMLQLQSEAKLA